VNIQGVPQCRQLHSGAKAGLAATGCVPSLPRPPEDRDLLTASGEVLLMAPWLRKCSQLISTHAIIATQLVALVKHHHGLGRQGNTTYTRMLLWM
jgi:hypothetical protein